MASEVGVALGEFSQIIIDALSPREFIAIDTFDMHKTPAHWGKLSSDIFENLTHEEFYRRRFESKKGVVKIMPGLSNDTLPLLEKESMDLIYIDAAHHYDGVRADAAIAAVKLKPCGFLIFNDYVMFDHLLEAPYGVVPTVNELVASGGWAVVGFALQQHMFCDMALRRLPHSSDVHTQ